MGLKLVQNLNFLIRDAQINTCQISLKLGPWLLIFFECIIIMYVCTCTTYVLIDVKIAVSFYFHALYSVLEMLYRWIWDGRTQHMLTWITTCA